MPIVNQLVVAVCVVVAALSEFAAVPFFADFPVAVVVVAAADAVDAGLRTFGSGPAVLDHHQSVASLRSGQMHADQRLFGSTFFGSG